VVMGEKDGIYTAEMKGKGVVRIVPNSVFVIPAQETFKLELKESVPLGNAHIEFAVWGNIDILSFYDFPQLIKEPVSLDIIDIVNELAYTKKDLDESFEVCSMIHLKQLSYHLLELLLGQAKPRSDMSKRLSEMKRIQVVLDYMNEHMSEDLNRKVLADLVNLSETRFHYVFKEIMGTSPVNYLMMQRMREAQKRLLVTEDSVSEIAQKVGFDNLSYFSKMFKSKFHVSPLQYRKMRFGGKQHNTLLTKVCQDEFD